MLAAAIGVDRAVEADIGRVVAGDDRARRVDRERGRQPGRFGFRGTPAVVERDPLLALEAATFVARGAASLARHHTGRHIHAPIMGCRWEHFKNIIRFRWSSRRWTLPRTCRRHWRRSPGRG